MTGKQKKKPSGTTRAEAERKHTQETKQVKRKGLSSQQENNQGTWVLSDRQGCGIVVAHSISVEFSWQISQFYSTGMF